MSKKKLKFIDKTGKRVSAKKVAGWLLQDSGPPRPAGLMRDIEDVLLDMYIDNYIEPSPDAVDIKAKDLKKELKRLHRKREKAKEVLLGDAKKSTGSVVNHVIDPAQAYLDFFAALESGDFISKKHQDQLGILIDRSRISEPDRRRIQRQTGAQILFFDQPGSHVKLIRDLMLDDPQLVELLDLGIFISKAEPESRRRGLGELIQEICPGEKQKKGRPPKTRVSANTNSNIIPIPRVYDIKKWKMNYRGLKIAIKTFAKIFALRGKSYEDIIKHPIIDMYKCLPFEESKACNAAIIHFWIQQAIDFR